MTWVEWLAGALLVALLALCGWAMHNERTACDARGGVVVYSSPIANGIPTGVCVAAPPPARVTQ